MDQSPLQRAMAALSNVYQTGKEQALNAMQAAQNRGVVGNITDALKGAGRAYSADIAGTPVDVRNMVSGALSPEGGGNPYASAIRNLIGPPDEKYSSDYFAKNLGIEGEGLAYDLGNMLGPEAAKAALRNITRPSVLNIFAGERAANAPLDKLTRAKEMDMATEAPEDIWKETGWFKGADEQWRWEIPDESAKLSLKQLDRMEAGIADKRPAGLIFERLLEHPEFFENYPEIGQMMVKSYTPAEGAIASFSHPSLGQASFDKVRKGKIGVDMKNWNWRGDGRQNKFWMQDLASGEAETIKSTRGVWDVDPDSSEWDPYGFVYYDSSLEKLREAILHEAQHAVQYAEQFGSLPQQAMGRSYTLNPHEAEARAIEARAKMTPEQRKSTFPFESYDVPIQDLDIP